MREQGQDENKLKAQSQLFVHLVLLTVCHNTDIGTAVSFCHYEHSRGRVKTCGISPANSLAH